LSKSQGQFWAAEIAENAEDFRLKSKNLTPFHAGVLACEKNIRYLLSALSSQLSALRSLLSALCSLLLLRDPVEPVELHGEGAPALG
jgi:hypothetical protein